MSPTELQKELFHHKKRLPDDNPIERERERNSWTYNTLQSTTLYDAEGSGKGGGHNGWVRQRLVASTCSSNHSWIFTVMKRKGRETKKANQLDQGRHTTDSATKDQDQDMWNV
jgi:hypothetical protein